MVNNSFSKALFMEGAGLGCRWTSHDLGETPISQEKGWNNLLETTVRAY